MMILLLVMFVLVMVSGMCVVLLVLGGVCRMVWFFVCRVMIRLGRVVLIGRVIFVFWGRGFKGVSYLMIFLFLMNRFVYV